MTAATPAGPRRLPFPLDWHRPLLLVAGLMALLALFALGARFLSTTEVTGLNQWDKPLKFALSSVIYTVTWSWLIAQVARGRRAARAAGTLIAAMLVVEVAVIAGAAAAGTTSHFNVSTPLSTTLWAVMAGSIGVLWLANFVVAAMLFRDPLGDRARTLAIRLGALISLVGLGLGYLMTSPTAQQLADFEGIAGAHTVGLPDGGPGLPVLGWSTVAGDLRIPHFVGMHALQALPLGLLVLELLSRRVRALADVRVRVELMWLAAAGYSAVVALVTWQALRGQSIVRPDVVTWTAAAAIVAGTTLAAAVLLLRRRPRPSPAPAAGSAEVPATAAGGAGSAEVQRLTRGGRLDGSEREGERAEVALAARERSTPLPDRSPELLHRPGPVDARQ
ncbi:hypothetical protein [Naasia sp. SYSU D00948]|uniref:hypothetical protein n=1 Tax=Naasia sp. SYSU D00948 TaxID=2817379 RepID=UPI0035A966AB